MQGISFYPACCVVGFAARHPFILSIPSFFPSAPTSLWLPTHSALWPAVVQFTNPGPAGSPSMFNWSPCPARHFASAVNEDCLVGVSWGFDSP
ncbi:uncharacterized protein LAESUDRAFT_57287 [Laetiporus sulphureus 93-53]|uniref:Uncharacterized protein n=1 Tax=Laetiporus sulphureus 93-53 TaxID=1314785 RepID=A0A165FE37_9APHY|nr:uncharacterized protein LAESUDRAFT_57287 [Laetiporus sulphureus 93-53]KZT08832.1 hypothetical protein LAESUDRAFT_57287 [Laetiporus sulphureus 93-53]